MGLIQEINEADSAKGKYFKLKIDGAFYSVFKNSPAFEFLNKETFKEGDSVAFTFDEKVKDGRTFRNIAEMFPMPEEKNKAIGITAPAKTPAKQEVNDSASYWKAKSELDKDIFELNRQRFEFDKDKSDQIGVMASINSAVNFFAIGKKKNLTEKEVFDLAKKFRENYKKELK